MLVIPGVFPLGLLQNEKISVGNSLKTMTHLDIEVAFAEHEYPVLEFDQNQLGSSVDIEQIKQTVSDCSDTITN